MEETFEDYRSFDSLESARFGLLNLLEANQIAYTIYRDNNRQDVILGKGLDFTAVWVRLQAQDVERVNRLLLEEPGKGTEEPIAEYLNEMSDEELLNILKKPDEWGITDYQVASKILAEHGIDVNEATLRRWKQERENELTELKRKEQAGGSIMRNVVIFLFFIVLLYFIVTRVRYV